MSEVSPQEFIRNLPVEEPRHAHCPLTMSSAAEEQEKRKLNEELWKAADDMVSIRLPGLGWFDKKGEASGAGASGTKKSDPKLLTLGVLKASGLVAKVRAHAVLCVGVA